MSPSPADKSSKKESPDFPLAWETHIPWNPGIYDLVANQFESDRLEHVSVVPLLSDEPWETVSTIARQLNPDLIMGIFPSFSQIEFRFHRAVRSLGMPTCTYEEAQTTVAASVVDELGVDAIIARAPKIMSIDSIVRQFSATPITYYQGILSIYETPLQLGLPVFYEQHLVPGMVGLFQCEHLAKEGDGYMHLSERFFWESAGDRLSVTDTLPVPRFSHATLPLPYLVRDEICACGAKRLAKPL